MNEQMQEQYRELMQRMVASGELTADQAHAKLAEHGITAATGVSGADDRPTGDYFVDRAARIEQARATLIDSQGEAAVEHLTDEEVLRYSGRQTADDRERAERRAQRLPTSSFVGSAEDAAESLRRALADREPDGE